MYRKVWDPLLFFMILTLSVRTAAQGTMPVQGPVAPYINIKTVPPVGGSPKLSFFCRQELKLQKASGLPLYIRLGSKEFVDKMERKSKGFGIRD